MGHDHRAGMSCAARVAALGAVLVAIATPAAAQRAQAKKAAADAVQQSSPAIDRNSVAREITSEHPDLVIESILLTGGGHVGYTVRNRSNTGTAAPFVVDVYLGERRHDTMKHDGVLAGYAQQAVVSSIARYAACETAVVRIVADPQQVVAEFDDANNAKQQRITPACPDFSVKIDRNWEDMNTRYRAHVTITNTGTAASRDTMVVKVIGSQHGLESVIDPNGLPVNSTTYVGPLAPGESRSFNASGKQLGTTPLYVKVFVDFTRRVNESREDNNTVAKKL